MAKFVSTADRIKAALVSNASESGSQRGLLLPWLCTEDETSQTTQFFHSSIGKPMGIADHQNTQKAADITEKYKRSKKITSLYPWQDDCLSCKALEERRNLLIAMPTSAGKTLVAEIVMLREIMINHRAVMLVLPYVSLVQEKVRGLIPLSLEFGFSVEEYASGKGSFPPPIRRRRQSLYVATIEKASSLMNAFIDPTLYGAKKRSVKDIGLVIVDEVHMLGDGERGAILEGTLIKLRAAYPEAQIVAMSATVGNLNELASCFDADIFQRDFRPVPLHEYVICNKVLYQFRPNKSGEDLLEPVLPNGDSKNEHPGTKPHPSIAKLDQNTRAQIKKIDSDDLFGLVGDLIIDKKQCLIFCATKRAAENVAILIAKILTAISSFTDVDPIAIRRQALLAQIVAENDGQCCPILQRTIPYGVAYHHAGLMPDERLAVESAYCDGLITILCCTSTLAAGVNLPARRVIVRSPYVASAFLTVDRYRQMAGRAGRAKLDTLGQCVVMCESKDLQKVAAMLSAPLNDCISCLNTILPSFTLELACIGLIENFADLKDKIRSFSLWHRQKENCAIIDEELSKVFNELVAAGLIFDCGDVKNLKPNSFGRAAMAANLGPVEAAALLADLKQAQHKLALASPLHLLYFIIPQKSVTELIDTVDFSILAREINRLQQAADLTALELLNISESYLARMRGSGSSTLSLSYVGPTPPASIVAALPYARLQLALVLRCIWYGGSFWEAASRFGLNRGSVFQLMSTATSYAHAAHRFAQHMPDLWPLADLMLSLNRRLTECPLGNYSELTDIPGVQYGRARQLAKAGFTNLATIATAKPDDLTSKMRHLTRRTAIAIIEAAKLALRESVRNLQEAADSIVEDTLTAALKSNDTLSQNSSRLPLLDASSDDNLLPSSQKANFI